VRALSPRSDYLFKLLVRSWRVCGVRATRIC
jgi:hypothetical protein